MVKYFYCTVPPPWIFHGLLTDTPTRLISTKSVNTDCGFYPFILKDARCDTNVRNASLMKTKFIQRRTASNFGQSRGGDGHPLGPNCLSDGGRCCHSGKGIASRQLISLSVRSRQDSKSLDFTDLTGRLTKDRW
jgi:hypothetical protein